MPAAKPVRNATTAKGVKPCVIASFPKTGASPRNIAELKAASIPAVCFFCKGTSLMVGVTDYLLNYAPSRRFSDKTWLIYSNLRDVLCKVTNLLI